MAKIFNKKTKSVQAYGPLFSDTRAGQTTDEPDTVYFTIGLAPNARTLMLTYRDIEIINEHCAEIKTFRASLVKPEEE